MWRRRIEVRVQRVSVFLRGLPWDEFGKIIVLIKGTAIGRAGFLCLVAGIAALTSPWQAVLFAALRRHGYDVHEGPLWISVLIGVGLVLLGVLLLVWNVRQGTTRKPEPTAHDVELYAQFRKLISDGDVEFFRTHSFGDSFPYKCTRSIDELTEGWKGGRKRFNDPEVDTALDLVKKTAAELNSELALKTYPVLTNMDRVTVMRENWGDFDVPMEIYDIIRDLNRLATQFVSAVDDFERIATARLYRPTPQE